MVLPYQAFDLAPTSEAIPEPLQDLSLDEMASLLHLKTQADEAQSVVNEHQFQARQVQISRLANYAQLGFWPKGLKFTKNSWAPGLQNKAPLAWELPTNSSLALTDKGICRIIKSSWPNIATTLGFLTIVGVIQLAVYSLVAKGPFWSSEYTPVIILTTIPGIFVGVLGAFCTENLYYRLGHGDVARLDPIPLDELSSSDLKALAAAEQEVQKLVTAKQELVKAAQELNNAPPPLLMAELV